MKSSLDLFGQVPISKLEVKRKVKKMPTVSIERIVAEIILEKMAGAFCLVYTQTGYQPYLRQFQIKEPTVRIVEAIEFYSGLCSKKAEYQPYIQSLKKFAKQNYKSSHDLALDQMKRNKKIEQINIAHQLIQLQETRPLHRLTQTAR